MAKEKDKSTSSRVHSDLNTDEQYFSLNKRLKEIHKEFKSLYAERLKLFENYTAVSLPGIYTSPEYVLLHSRLKSLGAEELKVKALSKERRSAILLVNGIYRNGVAK